MSTVGEEKSSRSTPEYAMCSESHEGLEVLVPLHEAPAQLIAADGAAWKVSLNCDAPALLQTLTA